MMLDSYGFDAAGSVAMAAFWAVYIVIYLLMFGFAVLQYILTARGLQVIAKRRGIGHSWLAWIPVGNAWVLGSISDQYQYLVKGRVRNRRKLLLGLSLAAAVLLLLWMIGVAIAALEMESAMNPSFNQIGFLVLICFGGMLLVFGIVIVLTIFLYMAYYDLFESCEPKNSLVFLLLGIFVSVTLPFLTFICRKKDEGMPARKDAQPRASLYTPLEAPVEPVPSEAAAPEDPADAAPVAEPTPEAPAEAPAVEEPVPEEE